MRAPSKRNISKKFCCVAFLFRLKKPRSCYDFTSKGSLFSYSRSVTRLVMSSRKGPPMSTAASPVNMTLRQLWFLFWFETRKLDQSGHWRLTEANNYPKIVFSPFLSFLITITSWELSLSISTLISGPRGIFWISFFTIMQISYGIILSLCL